MTPPQTPSVGELVPQPHGGALKRGGPNRGAGRRPSVVRKRAMAMFAKNLPILDFIARGVTTSFVEGGAQVLVTPKPSERVAAMKLLGEIGMGERVSTSEIRERLRHQVVLIRGQDTWSTPDLLAALAEVWK